MKIFIQFTCFLLLSSFLLSCTNDEEPTPEFPLHDATILNNEDYKIYSLLLNTGFPGNNNLVITQRTTNTSIDGPDYIFSLFNDPFNFPPNPNVNQQLIDSYYAQNETLGFLRNNFYCPNLNIRLTSPEEISYVMNTNNFTWDSFINYYNSEYLISFTRVSYNQNQDKALVEFNYSTQIETFGLYEKIMFYLEKENNNWVIKDYRTTEIS